MNGSSEASAMERLCRELARYVLGYMDATAWCIDHDIDTTDTTLYKDKENASEDIERRIEIARKEDEEREPVATTAESELTAKAAELDALRESGRVLPEGLEWPRYEDGEPVRIGEEFVSWDGKVQTVRAVEIYGHGPDANWAVNARSPHNFVSLHGPRLKRPEPPDSWERVEDDLTAPAWAYWQRRGRDTSGYPDIESMESARAKDVVRRAKALAGEGDGE